MKEVQTEASMDLLVSKATPAGIERAVLLSLRFVTMPWLLKYNSYVAGGKTIEFQE